MAAVIALRAASSALALVAATTFTLVVRLLGTDLDGPDIARELVVP